MTGSFQTGVIGAQAAIRFLMKDTKTLASQFYGPTGIQVEV
jgi:hypothetical protein